MYTVSKGPSKIVAKSRRGLSQNYEKFETIKESSKKSSDNCSPEKISTPRPVFQTTKKSQIHTRQLEEEHRSPQHEELIKYISDSWNMVVAQNPYDSTCTTATPMTNGHATLPDSNNNNCSNYIEKTITSAGTLSSATLAVYTNGKIINGNFNGSDNVSSSGSSISLSSISTASSSANTSPATSPQPHSPPVTTSTLYCVEPPSPVLKDFKPFDLEAWWGRRLFNNITKTI